MNQSPEAENPLERSYGVGRRSESLRKRVKVVVVVYPN